VRDPRIQSGVIAALVLALAIYGMPPQAAVSATELVLVTYMQIAMLFLAAVLIAACVWLISGRRISRHPLPHLVNSLVCLLPAAFMFRRTLKSWPL
jgi:Na+/phosphate symporter